MLTSPRAFPLKICDPECARLNLLNLLKTDDSSRQVTVLTGALKIGERVSTNVRAFWSMTAAGRVLRPRSRRSSNASLNG